MRIAVDFDDTIISQYDEIIKILNKRYNLNIDYNKVSYWNWTQDNYDEINRDEIMDIVYNFKPQHCKPADKNIAKYFNKIGKEHYIDIVTARWGPLFLKSDIYFTLGVLGLKNWNEIVLCGREYKQDMGYDLIIDDNPNLANGMIMDINKTLIVYSRPWNWNFECQKHPHIFRANNWKQVYKIVKSL